MTNSKDQVPIQSPPTNVQPAVPKANILSKVGSGISWWIGSLSGKPRAAKPVVRQPQNQAPPPVSQQPQASPTVQAAQPVQSNLPPEEDSVSQDLIKFKKLFGKFSSNVSKSVAPVVSKGLATSTQKAAAFGQSNKNFLRPVLKIFFIIVLLIVLGFVGLKIFRQLPQNGGNGDATPTPGSGGPTATPTPIVYNPTKPSIYAEDSTVLKLEEDLNVLVREISGTNIKETQLNPPVLDFAVSF